MICDDIYFIIIKCDSQYIILLKNITILLIDQKSQAIWGGNPMKLNYKRVFLVGLAFFLITMFWETYDSIIPKILTDKFGMSQTLSGVIMALDNVFALFLLPLFGSISDRCNSKRGKRTPFVLVGTVAACVLFVSLSFADNWQLTKIENIADGDQKAVLSELYNAELGDISDKIHAEFPTEDEFVAIDVENDSDTVSEYITPARQAYAWKMTASNPAPLILFVVVLLALLVSMSVFRSPAVALMPDVTPRPLRSKANAVINLMGTAAGAIVLALGIVFGTGKTTNTFMSYTVFFSVIAGLMMIALIVFMFTVKEKAWSAEATQAMKDAGLENEENEKLAAEHKRHLSSSELRSLILLLASVAFWYIGFNAVKTKYTVYAGQVLGVDYNEALLITVIIATAAFIPIGIISSKLGRKRVIMGGIALLSISFLVATFLEAGNSAWIMNVLFALAGLGWAAINVNSFPMVVELATGSDVGRYTGFYYAASMSAQTVAPVLSGLFLDHISMKALFPFGAFFVALSFVTMFFVKHGDVKPQPKKSLLEGLDAGDD